MQKTIWIYGDPHEVKDVPKGYRSLHRAIQDALGPMGGFDVAIDLGDHDASQGLPTDAAGAVVQAEFSSLTAAQRAQIYNISGNHDRSGPDEPAGWWFRKYLDPMGENTATSGVDGSLRPYAIDGTWERYKFQVGNVVFLLMSDVNRPVTPMRGILGGDPGGVVSEETWQWWHDQVESYKSGPEIIITCHHYLPRNTTIITGDYEGCTWQPSQGKFVGNYHGTGKIAQLSSHLGYVGEIAAATHFTDYLAANPGAVAMWFGGHNHIKPGQEINGRGHVVEKWGCTFVQAGALTQHHGVKNQLYPRSRQLILEDGESTAAMRHFFHTNTDFSSKGFWPNDRIVNLGKPIQL